MSPLFVRSTGVTRAVSQPLPFLKRQVSLE